MLPHPLPACLSMPATSSLPPRMGQDQEEEGRKEKEHISDSFWTAFVAGSPSLALCLGLPPTWNNILGRKKKKQAAGMAWQAVGGGEHLTLRSLSLPPLLFSCTHGGGDSG